MSAPRLRQLPNVSCETNLRLSRFSDLLTRWNTRINLIGHSTVEVLWSRHIEDSAQVFHYAPASAKSWLDLGSGAGLPGLVIAILAAETRPHLKVTLVEADQRKAAFLATAVRELGLDAVVAPCRIESLPAAPFDVISARALAPLADLLSYAERFRGENTICLFPKGKQLDSELTAAAAAWHIDFRRHASRTDCAGTILEILEFRSRL